MYSKSCGIYMIYNNITNQTYIGQSKNIFARWNEHYRASLKHNRDKSYLHNAMRKNNISCFWFKILEICDESELDEKEIFYIKLYESTVNNGNYNILSGGKGGVANGIKNHNSKLTDNDVFDIRESYRLLNNKQDTYNKYKNIVSFSTFSDVWTGKTWKHIHMDVYDDNTKKLQSKNYNHIKNHKRVVSNDEIIDIRKLRANGVKLSEAYEKYKHINRNTFYDVWYYRTFKYITTEVSICE